MSQQHATETRKIIVWNAKASKTSETFGESFVLQAEEEKRDANIRSPRFTIHHWKYGNALEEIKAPPKKIWSETCTSHRNITRPAKQQVISQTYPNKQEIGTESKKNQSWSHHLPALKNLSRRLHLALEHSESGPGSRLRSLENPSEREPWPDRVLGQPAQKEERVEEKENPSAGLGGIPQ